MPHMTGHLKVFGYTRLTSFCQTPVNECIGDVTSRTGHSAEKPASGSHFVAFFLGVKMIPRRYPAMQIPKISSKGFLRFIVSLPVAEVDPAKAKLVCACRYPTNQISSCRVRRKARIVNLDFQSSIRERAFTLQPSTATWENLHTCHLYKGSRAGL